MEDRTFLVAIMGLFSAASFIVWTVARAVVSARQTRTALPSADVEARLARIEAAVEAIAIEVERNGELQRFNARVHEGRIPNSHLALNPSADPAVRP